MGTNKYLPTSDHLNRPSHLRPNSTQPNSTQSTQPNQTQTNINFNPNRNPTSIWTLPPRTSAPLPTPAGLPVKGSAKSAMKRDPANDRQTARRASFEEQSIPKGAGFL